MTLGEAATKVDRRKVLDGVVRSVGPPAPNGTINRTGRAG